MAEVMIEKVADPTVSLLQVPEKRVIRIRSPSPFRGRSMTPVRGGRSMTPLAAYRTIRDKSETPSVWRSITPFISRDEKEKTPFEIGTNILQQLASYQAIFDKALVMDISLEEERPARFILSDASVIDKACILDLGNVEILYVEDDDELEESDYRESESPASVIEGGDDDSRERSAELTAGSDDEGGEKEQKKSKKKKPKKVVKKKVEKKEESPKLKLDMGDSKPKVNKAKMFEQQQKAAAEKPMDKPPPKAKTGKLSGALAAMKAEEQKMKDAEEQKKAIEEKMKAMKAEQEAKKTAAAEDEDAENEDGEHSENEDGSDKGKLH